MEDLLNEIKMKVKTMQATLMQLNEYQIHHESINIIRKEMHFYNYILEKMEQQKESNIAKNSNVMRKEKIIFHYIIVIDPAGIGKTGIIIYDIKQKYIYEHITIESKSDENAVENIYSWISKILELKNLLVIIENFQIRLNLKIKNVLSTPLFIGGLKALFKYKFNWPVILQEPNVRGTIKLNYKGNIKMSEHELDAWKHLQYFLKKESDKNAKSSKQLS